MSADEIQRSKLIRVTVHENSFTADGPNVVAFDNGPNFTVGVRAGGHEIGVEGTAIGMMGTGVKGISPDGFAVDGKSEKGIGVRGAGETGVYGRSTDEELGTGPGVGVRGSGYTGVLGQGRRGGPGGQFSAEPAGDSGKPGPQLNLVPARVPAGGIGVHPASPEEWRGYRFEADTVRQLPFEGQAGDLLLLTLDDADPDSGLSGSRGTSLWLCVVANRSVSESATFPAVWRQVLLGTPVSGERH